ncbi:secretion-regulating guanine nucleotide exchange factor isoform X2 [Pseudoliparis swirei]|uniref:secretion-regulating guanine nucleotide exchange factor isoform X2 n=1 Tax=Pseudoliparis swirei TaxID=2059687 RepID=UPI0024BD84BB|nr:secretion-regulating guanine nucleotide exchange factor isoform X2 [Pseudoliparis swirei]
MLHDSVANHDATLLMETSPRTEYCLHSWGANSSGQLAQGHVEDLSEPQRPDAAALKHRALRALSGGGGHTAAVTENGEVFVCGQNHRGQLGLGHNADVSTFQLCPSLNQRVTQVVCGWDFTLLLNDCGRVLACGSNAYGQLGVGQHITHSADLLVIESLEEPVVSVAAGLRHSLAVTGLDQKISHKVTAGLAHCVCLTGDGDLFLWGSNKRGQLTTTEPFLSSPTLVKRSLLGDEKVINVWSGWTHIVAQTESGKVFTWGRGDYGQLGRRASTSQNSKLPSTDPSGEGGNQEARLPAEVKVLRGATQEIVANKVDVWEGQGQALDHSSTALMILAAALACVTTLSPRVRVQLKIACGSEHNLAVVDGRLLSWGWNEHGMCGDGSQSDVFQPQLVSGLSPLLIGCGAGHSMATCAATTDSRQNSATTPPH